MTFTIDTVIKPLVMDGYTPLEMHRAVWLEHGWFIAIDTLRAVRSVLLEELYPSQHPDLDIFTMVRQLCLQAPSS